MLSSASESFGYCGLVHFFLEYPAQQKSRGVSLTRSRRLILLFIFQNRELAVWVGRPGDVLLKVTTFSAFWPGAFLELNVD